MSRLLIARVIGGTATTPVDPPTSAPSSRKVMGHYFPPYPLSIDNATPKANDYYTKNYIGINGESGKWAAKGGFMRDRPLYRDPLGGTSEEWKVADMVTEVRQAKAAGLDGFYADMINITAGNVQYDRIGRLATAAAAEGNFTVAVMLDTNGSTVQAATPAAAAAAIKAIYDKGAAWIEDGKLVISSFKAEGKTATWWGQVKTALAGLVGMPVAFHCIFLNASDANLAAYNSVADAFGVWGGARAQTATGAPNYVAKAAAYNKPWVAPWNYQDTREHSSVYAEAENTSALRATVARSINDGAKYVQVRTWNDFSEGTGFTASDNHGTSLMALAEFYSRWFKAGARPTITGDRLFLTHRIHRAGATPSTAGIDVMNCTLDGGGTPRNTIGVLVFTELGGTVKINGTTVGTAAAGSITEFTLALANGNPVATLTRGSTVVKSVTSPFTVVTTPVVPDYDYRIVDST